MQTIDQKAQLKSFIKNQDVKQQKINKIAKRTMSTEDIANTLGLIGMLSLQGATLPSSYNVIFNNGTPPPTELVALVFVGLIFYMVRAIRNIRYEWVYAIGNSVGLMSNGTLLLFIGGVL